MHSPTAMMTPEVYYIETCINSHGKPKLTLTEKRNITKTILKPIPMIFLLKNAPHSLPTLEYSVSNTVVDCTEVPTNRTLSFMPTQATFGSIFMAT